MADNFDPDAWAQKNGYAPQVPQAGAMPAVPQMSLEQKIAALRQKMANPVQTPAGQEGIMAPQSLGEKLMAPLVGAASTIAPGAAGVGGGLGALAAGHPFKEGYQAGIQKQNDILGRHPVLGGAGALAGGVLGPAGKAANALSLLPRTLATGAMGAAQGAGMATSPEDAMRNAGTGYLAGAGSTLGMQGLASGLKGLGGKLAQARPTLLDRFAKRGSEEIAKNPELSVMGHADSNAIGAPGPKSVPELKTIDLFRTPEERELAKTAGKAVPILQRSRPESAIVQTMGPQYVGKTIGDVTGDVKSSLPLYQALNRIGKLGGADIHGEQLKQNIGNVMAKNQLGPQSRLADLFAHATGKDVGESAREASNTVGNNLFYSPNAQHAGVSQMEGGAKSYLSDMEKNMANRHGSGFVPKPKGPASPSGTMAEGATDAGAMRGSASPVGETPPMEPHSSFLGAGQPSSKIGYSQYSPGEAADIGGAAERTNAINIGREASSTSTVSKWLKPGAGLYGKVTNPMLGALSTLSSPSVLEAGAGAASAAGRGIHSAGKGAENLFSKYITPQATTAAFLASGIPKNPDTEKEEVR